MCGSDKTIILSAQLFQELRQYCDRNGLRFVEFIEDALETAIHRHHLEALFNDENKLKERIDKERRHALQKGFDQGVIAATLVLRKKIIPQGDLISKEIRERLSFQPVTGGQAKLFE